MKYVILSVPDLFDVCIDRCETAQLECILSCENDLICLSQCISEATSCIEGKFRNLLLIELIVTRGQIFGPV